MTEENFWLMKSTPVQLLLGSQGIDIFYQDSIRTSLELSNINLSLRLKNNFIKIESK